jgi:hypothetical protein
MPYCIKESEFNPEIHAKVTDPEALAWCQQNCDQVGGLAVAQAKDEKSDCGCGGR